MIRAVLVVFLFLAAGAGAAEKTDLSAFFTGGGTVGDYEVWRSETGETRSHELVGISVRKNRIMFLSETIEDGIVGISESGLIPGKWLLDGGVLIEGVEIYIAKPFKTLPLKVVPGKAYRYRGSGRVYFMGERVGKAKITGSTTFVGFGPVESPEWSSSNAANFVGSSTVTIKIKGGGELTSQGTSSWSTDQELGSFIGTEESRTYENGTLVEEEGPTTWWLESGEFGGVPFP